MNDIVLNDLKAGKVASPSFKDNAASDSPTLSGSGINYLQKVTNIVGAGGSTALSHDDSGTLFIITSADGAHTFTLPALKAGFTISVINTVVSDNDIVVTAPGDNMIASCTQFTASGAAQSVVADTCTTMTLNADTVATAVNTRFDIYCDGTNYIMIGTSELQSGTALWVAS